MLSRPFAPISTLAFALILLACGGGHEEGADAGAGPAASPVATASAATPVSTGKARRPANQRPLPAFQGYALDGQQVSAGAMLGQRFLLFLFNPEIDVAGAAGEAVAKVAALAGANNFSVLGVGTGSRRSQLEAYVAEHELGFPVIDDSSARIAGLLRVPVPVLVATVDAEGYVIHTTGWREGTEIDARGIESALREALRLPAAPEPTHPVLGERPRAPEVAGTDLSGKAFRLSTQRGRPVLLMFFLHTCPHCHHAMKFLKTELPKLPEASRPVFIGISVVDRAFAVRERLKGDGLDFFPVLMDPDGAIREAYGANGGVPQLVLIDGEGRIVHRSSGWHDERDPPLLRMWMAKVSGEPIPMLLHKTGYSGNEFCGVCHDLPATTWNFTKHAYAFDTLVKHAAERDGECVSCHVVGYDQPEGYSLGTPHGHLENVGCESCHGRGGPHLSPDFVKEANYEPVCVQCHDTKHSLGFDYALFSPKVSHAANAHLAALPLDGKLAAIEKLGATRKALIPSKAAYVGSDACRSCHEAEYETWSKSNHAHAGETLVDKGQGGNAECLPCHTTAYGKTGGFPEAQRLVDHADLARVGCESCHGPGGDHVGQNATRFGTILSLGDKCDSCVILQICGECHDDNNDAGFEFRVQERIEDQRHGTTEPGTGRPKSASAVAPEIPHAGLAPEIPHAGLAPEIPHTAILRTLEQAFGGPAS